MSLCRSALFAFASVLAVQGIAHAAKEKPLTKTEFDPNAKQVELFDAIDEKLIDYKLIAKNAMGGALFITNKTDEPLTVKMPDSFVAVPVNAQFGGGMGGMGGGMGGMGGMGGGMGGMGGGMGGGQQSMGGGMGGMGGGGMGGMGGGMGGMGGGGMGGNQGFFSIPAEKTLRVPYTSVCLNHGLQEPMPHSRYRIVRTEEYTNNPVLQSLISMVGTGRLNGQAAQAATWSITDNLSWQQLASKRDTTSYTPSARPYFSADQLMAAQNIVSIAHNVAAEREKAKENGEQPKAQATQPVPARVLQTR